VAAFIFFGPLLLNCRTGYAMSIVSHLENAAGRSLPEMKLFRV